jgi:hypothetical protein
MKNLINLTPNIGTYLCNDPSSGEIARDEGKRAHFRLRVSRV